MRLCARTLACAVVLAPATALPWPVLHGDTPASPVTGQTMAITVDDLPATPATDLSEMQRITNGVLAAFRKHHVPAIGFVNEGALEPAAEGKQRSGLLRKWLDAGLDLGNHTYSHAGFQKTVLADYEQEVLKGEVETRKLLAERGRAPRYFRHPYTQTGPTAAAKRDFEAFLAGHGYAVAPFSIETSDYVFDALRRDAVSRRDRKTQAALLSAYLDHAAAVTEFMEGLARDTFGRAIPQVLLLHASGTNAEALGELLTRLEARGCRFVRLEEALADAAWKTRDDYIGQYGPSWLHRFQLAKGRPLRIELEPDPPKWVLDAYKALPPR